jgi:hypothetical protein
MCLLLPKQASTTQGLPDTSLWEPSAILRPKARAITRSEIDLTGLRLWSSHDDCAALISHGSSLPGLFFVKKTVEPMIPRCLKPTSKMRMRLKSMVRYPRQSLRRKTVHGCRLILY